MLCGVISFLLLNFLIAKNMYEQIKTKENYDKLLSSGMFWEFYPELTGDWIKDISIIYSHDCFEDDNRFAKTHIQYKEYCKSDFQSGAEFIQKEYEEKLRWIPVEERLPAISTLEKYNVVNVKFKTFKPTKKWYAVQH
jgi:hypothetical protein